MHTIGESEHFSTDMLKIFIFAILTAIFQTLACLFNSISNFVDQLIESNRDDWPRGGPETAVDIIY